MKRPALALVLICLPLAAMAKDDFKNLPGVHDPAKMKERPIDTVCTSQLEWQRPAPGRNGLAYRTYKCRYGKAWVGSSRPPNLIEYRKYKNYYD
jgi:hypothetical protein